MTKVINITALKAEPAVKIVIDGVTHSMRNPTVNSFIANMEIVESLGIDASPVKEMMAMVKIIALSFPTLKEAEIRDWPLTSITQLSELARGIGGDDAATQEAADEAAELGNAPAAI